MSIDYSALAASFSTAPSPSPTELEISANPATVAALDFFSDDNSSQNYASISTYVRTAEKTLAYYGRLYKLYCALHSVVTNDDKNLPAVLANLESKFSYILAADRGKVPTKVFGKTGIDMPVLTLGTMRFQETWNGTKHTDPATIEADVNAACQANLKAVLLAALDVGINHIETARGYGASEIQLGLALKEIFAEGKYKREDVIIQTKVSAKATQKEFLDTLETSFKYMQVDYFDLFSFHGLNKYSDYDLMFKEDGAGGGGLYECILPYLADGRIRHAGFSTHAPNDLICKFIATDKFSHVNLHYHWCGSYTAAGHAPTEEGCGPGNESAVKMCRDRNMGVFCISPVDKGGGVHNASYKFRKMTEAQGMDPVEFSVAWTVNVHDTQTIGCSKPEDLDEVYHAAMRSGDPDYVARVASVQASVDAALVGVAGQAWNDTWWKGLPHCFETDSGVNFPHYVWFYNLLHAFGLKWYVEQRHGTGVGNKKKWDEAEGSAADKFKDWGFMPGNMPEVGKDYSEELKNVPAENLDRVKQIIADFDGLMKEFAGDECKSVDMRPWKAFPER